MAVTRDDQALGAELALQRVADRVERVVVRARDDERGQVEGSQPFERDLRLPGAALGDQRSRAALERGRQGGRGIESRSRPRRGTRAGTPRGRRADHRARTLHPGRRTPPRRGRRAPLSYRAARSPSATRGPPRPRRRRGARSRPRRSGRPGGRPARCGRRPTSHAPRSRSARAGELVSDRSRTPVTARIPAAPARRASWFRGSPCVAARATCRVRRRRSRGRGRGVAWLPLT